jgi:hypothetical protein
LGVITVLWNLGTEEQSLRLLIGSNHNISRGSDSLLQLKLEIKYGASSIFY